MKIRIEELESMLGVITSKAKKLGIEEVETENDYYWVVSSDDLFNFSVGSPKINVGSLIDDYENLVDVINKEQQPSIVDFDRISNLIKAIGECIGNSSKIY